MPKADKLIRSKKHNCKVAYNECVSSLWWQGFYGRWRYHLERARTARIWARVIRVEVGENLWAASTQRNLLFPFLFHLTVNFDRVVYACCWPRHWKPSSDATNPVRNGEGCDTGWMHSSPPPCPAFLVQARSPSSSCCHTLWTVASAALRPLIGQSYFYSSIILQSWRHV